jgi:hypothetical protein
MTERPTAEPAALDAGVAPAEPRPAPSSPGPAAGPRPSPATLARTQAAIARRAARRGRPVASYEVRRVDAWSVLKLSLVFYSCLFLVVIVAGIGLWVIAAALGVIGNVEQFFGELLGSKDFHFLGLRILQAAALGGLVLVAIASGLTTLAAVFYNLITELVGGVDVTLGEARSRRGPRV